MIIKTIKLTADKLISPIFEFFWYTFLDTYMKKVERLVMKSLLSVFHFFTRHVSYTFSVALITSMGGFLIAIYIALFLYATVHFDSNETARHFVDMFILMICIAYIPGYYLHFGILSRLGVPCFSKSLNIINSYTKYNEIKEFRTPDEGTMLLGALEHLPVENIKAAAIYPVLVMIPTVLQEYIIGRKYNALVLLAGISSAIFIYVFFTYISAELLTGEMRQLVKRRLANEKIVFEENFSFSIRKKFLFITFLVLIAMTELVIMFYFGSMRIKTFIPVLFVFFTILTLAILLFFYLISIEQSLQEIEYAAVDLSKGGKGKLFLSGMDKELITLGRGIISAAYEVNEVRGNLERKVEERTLELNSALQKLKEKDNRIQIELKLASDIQKGILPHTPMKYNFINVVSYYKPMQKVSGDFYDLVPMEDGGLAIIIGDVSGHGIPAALVNSMLKISFNDALRKYNSPKEIFKYINSTLMGTIKTDEYLTAIIAIISPTHDVIFSNASHRRAIVMHAGTGEIHEWDTGGLPVGAMIEAGETYEDKITSLEFGDRVMLFTDGLVEARDTSGVEFGESKLHELLRSTMNSTIEKARDIIISIWEEYTRGVETSDDVTLLLIEIDPLCRDFRAKKNDAIRLFRKNMISEAITVFEELSESNCDDKSLLKLLAKAYIKSGNYSGCISVMKKFISEMKPDAADYYILAVANYNLKNFPDAIEAAVQACRLNPEHEGALSIQALSRKKQGRHEEAESLWKLLLSFYPDNETALKELKKTKDVL
jgi:serine phosphatase RsbU (regulator of sigma subunit)